MLLGFEPAENGGGIALVEATGALTTMEERGTAVGFCDAKVKVGVGPVGVGNKEVERLALEPLEPEATGLELAAGALPLDEDETAEEAAATT